MKLFVYEHLTSGALAGQPLPESLVQEGREMLSAIVQDCLELTHIEIITLCDARLKDKLSDLHTDISKTYTVSNNEDYRHFWQQALNETDSVFIIAPETDNTLANLQALAYQHGKHVIGCSPQAILLCSDKLACEQQLAQYGIATPSSVLASEFSPDTLISNHGYIVKPNDGAGCIETRFLPTQQSVQEYLGQLTIEQRQRYIVQAYLTGTPASLSICFHQNKSEILSINQQYIEHKDNELYFTGCGINMLPPAEYSLQQASDLAAKVHQAIPELAGFVGIDIIVSQQGAFIVDINPRLTTSYIGLKESLGINPMAYLFSLETDKPLSLPAQSERKKVTITL